MGLLTLSFTVKWSAWVLSLGLSQCQIFRSLFMGWPDSPEKHLFVSCLEVKDRLPRFWKLSKEWRLGTSAFSKHTLISSVFNMVALPSIVPSAPQSRGPLFYTLEGIKHQSPAWVEEMIWRSAVSLKKFSINSPHFWFYLYPTPTSNVPGTPKSWMFGGFCDISSCFFVFSYGGLGFR